ncbi:hypothetical protein ACS0TY_034334 [Phlomoides rotata]
MSLDIIKDMYDRAVSNVRACRWMIVEFVVTIGLHQVSTIIKLIPIYGIQTELHWTMLYVDDVVLIEEMKAGAIAKLDLWREILEYKDFRVSRSKMEYMDYNLI